MPLMWSNELDWKELRWLVGPVALVLVEVSGRMDRWMLVLLGLMVIAVDDAPTV